ncbi:putative peptidyl-tRNA hydrolase 2 [Haematobia irritans]|uniref:putative peptidyl-tRNA hydrolase 2 n=1 Tax=Haematobia irritans TaxID=7368 RepID=UPI003F5061C2
MGDRDILSTSNIVNGVTVLLSFFVGYKYALKRNNIKENHGAVSKMPVEKGAEAVAQDSERTLLLSANGNLKMVLLVRNDLKMGKGKIAAQCGHGAVGAYQKAQMQNPRILRLWENTGAAKVALKVESEPEMMALKRAAESKGLVTCLIRDAGRTQIAPNSKTVLAVGPGPVEVIDQVTGHLKLL